MGFLTNCSILFALQPHTFSSEEAKVAFTTNHLMGRARLWGAAEWERWTPACGSFQSFATELRRVFGGRSYSSDAAGNLLSMHQGNQTVADFATDFRIRVTGTPLVSGRDETSTCFYSFMKGFSKNCLYNLLAGELKPTTHVLRTGE